MSAQDTSTPSSDQGQVEYRDVVGFPGYRVGDDGSIWSCWRNGGNDRSGQVLTNIWHRLNGWVDKRRGKPEGYIKVGLMREGKLHRLRAHRLVLEAFSGPCPEGMEARHLDDDKSNNRLDNLIWGTPTENAVDRHRNGLYRIGEANHRAKLTADGVRFARLLLASGWSQRKVALLLGMSCGAIRAIHVGRTWKDIG